VVQNQIIDGKAIASSIRNELKQILARRNEQRKPGLAVLLVGDDPASQFYVQRKRDACHEIGINSFQTILEANITKEKLIEEIEKYNLDDNVDGILLQLPLPKTLEAQTQEIIDHINPAKDVDGLTSYNLGQLLVRSAQTIYPCTPKACIELLKHQEVILKGKKILVIGRSTLVGMPLALILNQYDATVTMAHSKTLNLKKEVSQADIVIAAIGVPEFIEGSWLKPNAVVIDVGINAILKNSSKRLVGDVEFKSALNVASLITPVPGGVGPMTVAMLLSNTVELWQRKF
jgi:methylenetetrahydrofolate dehydrogenase (NADP+) / methenyltetrahydrofolate cyclohydrolase